MRPPFMSLLNPIDIYSFNFTVISNNIESVLVNLEFAMIVVNWRQISLISSFFLSPNKHPSSQSALTYL